MSNVNAISRGLFLITPAVAHRRAYGLYVEGSGFLSFVDGTGETITDFQVDDFAILPFEVRAVTAYTGSGNVYGVKGVHEDA